MVVSSMIADLVKVGSHLDVRNVAQVRTVLHDVIASAEGDIIVDMAGVEMIDAAGLGMLTAAHLRAQRAGHHLVLAQLLRRRTPGPRRHAPQPSAAHRPPLSLTA